MLVLGFALWSSEVPDAAFVITGALVAAGVLLTVVGMREPPPAAWVADRLEGDASAERHRSPWGLLTEYRGAAVRGDTPDRGVNVA